MVRKRSTVPISLSYTTPQRDVDIAQEALLAGAPALAALAAQGGDVLAATALGLTPLHR
jgi:hypothetical protein